MLTLWDDLSILHGSIPVLRGFKSSNSSSQGSFGRIVGHPSITRFCEGWHINRSEMPVVTTSASRRQRGDVPL